MKKLLLIVAMVLVTVSGVPALTIDIDIDSASWCSEILSDENVVRLIDAISGDYGKYESGEELGRGMSNANVLAANSGYMNSAWGYKYVAASLSTNLSLAMDGSFSDISGYADDYRDNGDLYVGLGVQVLNASVGVNLGHILGWSRDFYVTLKAGKSDLSLDDLSLDSYNFGIMLNYPVLSSVKLTNLFMWRGLNVGAGFNYYNSVISYELTDLDPVKVSTGGSAYLEYDTDLDIEIENSDFIVPIEVSTGFKALIFDLYGGLGMDLHFSRTNEASADTTGRVRYFDGTKYMEDATKGNIKIKSEGDTDRIKGKVFAGLGLTMGPVHIEIPLSYYFGSDFSGSVGLIGGVAF